MENSPFTHNYFQLLEGISFLTSFDVLNLKQLENKMLFCIICSVRQTFMSLALRVFIAYYKLNFLIC